MNKRTKAILAGVSTKDLLEELSRRRAVDDSQAGKDWYYKFGDEENEPGDYHTVWIVHKRFWHENHHMDDRHIEHLVTMPSGFNECQESCFDFEWPIEDAERMLREYGYTPLPTEEDVSGACWSALISQCMTISGVPWRVSMHADTPEIKEAILAAMADTNSEFNHRSPGVFENWDQYRNWMRRLANSLDCAVKWYNTYGDSVQGGGEYGCMMKNEVFMSLPPPPHEIDDE